MALDNTQCTINNILVHIWACRKFLDQATFSWFFPRNADFISLICWVCRGFYLSCRNVTLICPWDKIGMIWKLGSEAMTCHCSFNIGLPESLGCVRVTFYLDTAWNAVLYAVIFIILHCPGPWCIQYITQPLFNWRAMDVPYNGSSVNYQRHPLGDAMVLLLITKRGCLGFCRWNVSNENPPDEIMDLSEFNKYKWYHKSLFWLFEDSF